MDAKTVARIVVPRLPLLITTYILNILSLSKNSSKQDARTELTVVLIRSLMRVKRSLSFSQKIGLKDPGIKGPMWIAKASCPIPAETDVRNALVAAIKELGNGEETYTLPDLHAVSGEWTGYRNGVPAKEVRPDVPEAEQYQRLMDEVTSPVTVLYFHGGAYFLMDPSSHREVTSNLAKATKGRCFSVRYRLAPQNPFPAQLLDALTSYLYLLSPSPGAFHEPIPAKHIVFAGDSAGANLAIVLMQLILALRRIGTDHIRFHGKDVALDVPAGVAVNSPWTDISRSMPSVHNNAHFDYLDPPSKTGFGVEPEPDDIWPTMPPRVEIYCDASVLTHPLASPLAASIQQWQGMPPIFICCGNEGLEDDACIIARKMYESGGTVLFAGYEGAPHCFSMIFPKSIGGRDCFKKWSQFCSDAVDGKLKRTQTAYWMKAFSNPPTFKEVSFANVGPVSDEEATRLMEGSKTRAMTREQKLRQQWESAQIKPRL